MTVLFITRSPLSCGNSTGQTLCNFFDTAAMPSDEFDFHVLTLDRGQTEPGFAASTLCVGNWDLLRALLGKPMPAPYSDRDAPRSSSCPRSFRRIKGNTTLRYLAYLPRDLLWMAVSRSWKRAVRDYVQAVKPDIVFFPTSGQGYHHRVLSYVRRLCRARIVLYHGDDHYSLVTGSPNPIFTLRRLTERVRIRRAVAVCDSQFGASELQCRSYEQAMGKPCIFLSKSMDFSLPPSPIPEPNGRLSFVYTGNILLGRWESLLYLATLLEALGKRGYPASLTVYTANSLTPRMNKQCAGMTTLQIAGAVPPNAIPAIQSRADVLVHAESFARTHRAIVRQSFSTKLVDYFHAARPILAVGPVDVASVEYLCRQDAALHLTHDFDSDLSRLRSLFNVDRRRFLAARAYACGRVGHDRTVMRERLTRALCQPPSGA